MSVTCHTPSSSMSSDDNLSQTKPLGPGIGREKKPPSKLANPRGSDGMLLQSLGGSARYRKEEDPGSPQSPEATFASQMFDRNAPKITAKALLRIPLCPKGGPPPSNKTEHSSSLDEFMSNASSSSRRRKSYQTRSQTLAATSHYVPSPSNYASTHSLCGINNHNNHSSNRSGAGIRKSSTTSSDTIVESSSNDVTSRYSKSNGRRRTLLRKMLTIETDSSGGSSSSSAAAGLKNTSHGNLKRAKSKLGGGASKYMPWTRNKSISLNIPDPVFPSLEYHQHHSNSLPMVTLSPAPIGEDEMMKFGVEQEVAAAAVAIPPEPHLLSVPVQYAAPSPQQTTKSVVVSPQQKRRMMKRPLQRQRSVDDGPPPMEEETHHLQRGIALRPGPVTRRSSYACNDPFSCSFSTGNVNEFGVRITDL